MFEVLHKTYYNDEFTVLSLVAVKYYTPWVEHALKQCRLNSKQQATPIEKPFGDNTLLDRLKSSILQ
jgi:hypothetical protein